MDAVEIRTATADDLQGVVASSAALFAEDSGTRDPLRNADWPAVHGAKWVADLLEDPDALVLVASDPRDAAISASCKSSALFSNSRRVIRRGGGRGGGSRGGSGGRGLYASGSGSGQ